MIEKERTIPRILLILQALLRRLPLNHPKIPQISEEIGKRMAGFKGEKSLDYPLSFLEPKKYFILHDLRIPYKDSFFQLDTLLISTKFILIIEVKYISGIAYFDPVFNQLIQTKAGTELALPDPTVQIKRQGAKLLNWLTKNGFFDIPLSSFVVMSNDRSIIKTTSENKTLNKIVIHRHNLLDKVRDYERLNRKESLSTKDLKKLIRTLKRHHTEARPSILERFSISEEDLLKGVICQMCNNRPLVRKHSTWVCIKCERKDKSAHIQALKDYELLIGPTITNNQLRKYLQIDSSHVAKRLLQSLNLSTTGTKKGTKYILSLNEKSKQKTHQ
ncbi:NERD domain-containing protein [Bacillus sp. BHET2]|uniref:nuclease-related domain-containing protein n=1 Tax=Bacillus sp. BHET2 TaxID=2583818 RepID=UPI00110DE172|nr:nuclease-related domain-containing protein [Bacillus sp. BHET2]TMU84445.1 NERD domain-containing protein [Bacillus sp. BHET2]